MNEAHIPPELVVERRTIASGKDFGKLKLDTIKKSEELLQKEKTNKEKFGDIPAITREQYTKTAAAMKAKFDERYPEETDVPSYEHFEFPWMPEGYYEKVASFDIFSVRAKHVFDELKLFPRITSRKHFLGSLREAYHRLGADNQSIKNDIRRLYMLTVIGDINVDHSEALVDSLINSKQTPEVYMTVFAKLLADEAAARKEGGPAIEQSNEYLEKIQRVLQDQGLMKKPFPEIEDITLGTRLDSVIIDRPMLEENLNRTGGVGGFALHEEYRLHSDTVYMVMKTPFYLDNMRPEDIKKSAKEFASFILHEYIHLNGLTMEKQTFGQGSWQEEVLEMITDTASLEITNKSGLGNRDESGFYTDWADRTGYH